MVETNFASRIKKNLRIKEFRRNFSKEKIGEKMKNISRRKKLEEKLKKMEETKFASRIKIIEDKDF